MLLRFLNLLIVCLLSCSLTLGANDIYITDTPGSLDPEKKEDSKDHRVDESSRVNFSPIFKNNIAVIEIIKYKDVRNEPEPSVFMGRKYGGNQTYNLGNTFSYVELDDYMTFYNTKRPHQGLKYSVPDDVYQGLIDVPAFEFKKAA